VISKSYQSQKRANRSKLECAVVILKQLRKTGKLCNKLRLQRGVGLSYTLLVELLVLCAENGLVRERNRFYALTDEGIEVLKAWAVIEGKLGFCLKKKVGFDD